jgi:hypothetical protein
MKEKKTNKRVLYLIGILLVAVFTFNRCAKDEISSSKGSAVKSAVIPADKSTLDPLSAADLKWSADPSSGGTYNIYFSDQPAPALYKAGVSGLSLNVPVSGGKTYYWKVGTVSSNGTESLGPVYSFKVKLKLDINQFAGLYSCDEPRYTKYDVNASRLGGDTLVIDNFWDLKWTVKYVFDDLGNVKIVPATFYPDPKLAYMVSGAGTFDNEKKEFKVNYTITQKVTGEADSYLTDQNTHIFQKK